MAVSISDLVQRVRDNLGERPYAIELTLTVNASEETLLLTSTTGLAVGSVLEFQSSGYEQVYVKEVTNSTTVEAYRGWNGTTAASQAAPLKLFVLTPQQTSSRVITQMLTRGVNELWPWVYKTGTVNLTPDSTAYWYDLNAATAGIVGVAQLYGTGNANAGLFGTRGNYPFRTNFGLPTALVASGKGIRFPSGLYHQSNDIIVTDMRVVTGSSDIEDTAQFPVADCVVNWATGLVLEASEIFRVRAGEALDTAASVSTGQRLQTGAWFLQQGKKDLERLAIVYERFYQPVQMRRA